MVGRVVVCCSLVLLVPTPAFTAVEVPQQVTVCALKADPGAYNRRLVEVTGFVSHAFEDFSLLSPECLPWMGVWLEYGGTAKSDTIYCCGSTGGRHRPKPLIVEKIPIPLVRDDAFRRFNEVIQRHKSVLLHATLVGRFFAGQKEVADDGREIWTGYGHMGCCSLLAIQQVRTVDPTDRQDVDYDPFPDMPRPPRVGCGSGELTEPLRMDQWITAQRVAEERQPWAFEDPQRVAAHALAGYAAGVALETPNEQRRAQGRIVYEWPAAKNRSSYAVVVSRPYVVTFYARDPQRVAWIAVAVHESACDAK